MPVRCHPMNRAPWTDAERTVITRHGITEKAAAKALMAELGIYRSAAAVGIERRRMNAELRG